MVRGPANYRETLSSDKLNPDKSRPAADETTQTRPIRGNPKNRFGILLRMNALEQNYKKLLYWSKFTCEEVEAQYEKREDSEPPSWLAELRAACDAVEDEGGEAME